MLEDLLSESKKLIRLSDEDSYVKLGKIVEDNERVTFKMLKDEGIRLDAKITSLGRMYLIDLRRQETQTVFTKAATVATWTAAIFAVLTFLNLRGCLSMSQLPQSNTEKTGCCQPKQYLNKDTFVCKMNPLYFPKSNLDSSKKKP